MNKMIKQIRHKTPRHARGFTLVEMMVTMVIVSVVLAATYQAFGDTSAAMYEVDSLAGTLDKGRFALEIMSRDVQSAGAFASPDARTDALSYGEQIGTSNVYGLYAFDGARVQIEPLQSEFNRATASDEIIVLGAYDYPVNFEVSFPGGDLAHPFAPNIHRGALRFRQLDPFNVNLIDAMGEALTTEEQGPLVGLMLSRLLRVTDRNGYSQFAPITATTYNPDVNSGGLNFTVGSGAMTFRERPADGLKGFEPASEDDAFYSAAILDVYRYRVCADPYDGTSLKLVRERLDANTVVSGAALPRPQVCGAGSIGVGNAIVSQDTIVDRVVDFRVWYDCADPTSRLMEGVTWHDGWFPPDGDDAGHNCVYLNATGRAAGGGLLALARSHGAHAPVGAHGSRVQGSTKLRLFACQWRLRQPAEHGHAAPDRRSE